MKPNMNREPSSVNESWSSAVVALHSHDGDDNDNDTPSPVASDPPSPALHDDARGEKEKGTTLDNGLDHSPSSSPHEVREVPEGEEKRGGNRHTRTPHRQPWNVSPNNVQPRPMSPVANALLSQPSLSLSVHETDGKRNSDKENGGRIRSSENTASVKITVTSNYSNNKDNNKDNNDKPPRHDAAGRSNNAVASTSYIEHEVLRTDTLQGLCLAYKISATRLRMENKFSGDSLQLAPKTLRIPVSSERFNMRSLLGKVGGSMEERKLNRAAEEHELEESRRRLRDAIESLSAQVDDYRRPLLTTPERTFLERLLRSNGPGVAEARAAAVERLEDGDLFWNAMCGAVVETNVTISKRGDAAAAGPTTGVKEANPMICSSTSDLFSRAGHSRDESERREAPRPAPISNEDVKIFFGGSDKEKGGNQPIVSPNEIGYCSEANKGRSEDIPEDGESDEEDNGGEDVLATSERTVVVPPAAASSSSAAIEKTPAAMFNYLDNSTKERIDRLAQRRRQSSSVTDNTRRLFRAHEAGLVVTPGGSARRSLARMGLPVERALYDDSAPPPRMPLSPAGEASPDGGEGGGKALYNCAPPPPRITLSPIQDCNQGKGGSGSELDSEAEQQKVDDIIISLSKQIRLDDDDDTVIKQALAKKEEQQQQKEEHRKRKKNVWSKTTERAVARPSRTHHHMGCITPFGMGILKNHFASKQFSIRRENSGSSSYTRYDSFLLTDTATETFESDGLLLRGSGDDDDCDSLLDDAINTGFLGDSIGIGKKKNSDVSCHQDSDYSVLVDIATDVGSRGDSAVDEREKKTSEGDDATRDAASPATFLRDLGDDPPADSSALVNLRNAALGRLSAKNAADDRLKNLLINAGVISTGTLVVDARLEDDLDILSVSTKSMNSVAVLMRGGPSYRNVDMFRSGAEEEEGTPMMEFLINAGLRNAKSYDAAGNLVVDAQPEDDESVLAMSTRSTNSVAMLMKGGPSFRNVDMFRSGGSEKEYGRTSDKEPLVHAGFRHDKSYDTTDKLVVDALTEDDESILAMSTRSTNSVAMLMKGGPLHMNADMFRSIGGNGQAENELTQKDEIPVKMKGPVVTGDMDKSNTSIQASDSQLDESLGLKSPSATASGANIKENLSDDANSDDGDASIPSLHSDLGELPSLQPQPPPTDRLSQSARCPRRATVGIIRSSSSSADNKVNKKYKRSVSWNRKFFDQEEAKKAAARSSSRRDPGMSVITFPGLGTARMPIFRSDSIGSESSALSSTAMPYLSRAPALPSLSLANPICSPKAPSSTTAVIPPLLSRAHSIRSDFGALKADSVMTDPEKSTSSPLLSRAHSIRSDFGMTTSDSSNTKEENAGDDGGDDPSSLSNGAAWESNTKSRQPASNENHDPSSTNADTGGEGAEEEHPVFIHPTSKTQNYEGVGMEIEDYSPAAGRTVVIPSAHEMAMQTNSREKCQCMISVIDDSARSRQGLQNLSAKTSRSGSMFSRHAPPPIKSLDDSFIIKNIHFERHSSEILRSLSNEDMMSTRSSRGGKSNGPSSTATRATGDMITEAASWDDLETSSSPAASANAWGVLEDEYAEGYGANGTLPFRILGTSADDTDCHPHVLSPPLMESLQNFLPPSISDNANFWLKYSLVRDGPSLPSLLRHVRGTRHALIAIETVGGEVFGSFTSSPWRKNLNYTGGNSSVEEEAFLWRMRRTRASKDAQSSVLDQAKLESELDVYYWTAGRDNANRMVQYCTHNMLAIGGGDPPRDDNNDDGAVMAEGREECDSSLRNPVFPETARGGRFGLAIDAELLRGTSSFCGAFRSPPLSASHSDGSPFEILNVEVWTMTPCGNIADAEDLEMKNLFLEG
eukprot:CAMPEP_0172537994 /NCGR_PEP_ID=MMETSP1067-20121228/9486_1 /TAXON_ID=265564 ORGANISM="Thalassiosira punctigera, Strain Tpunct2005C2" /NCGR_SAMPLE_ID=MMETSP1067 /ASSEMBLY_ACC=CAM_ASM_000444 /LENGTH=1848 /DNA_ID=CAMNT_0013323403 /DNA_START=213 /DNA_END=5759 /DNA_ORIENTATION=+